MVHNFSQVPKANIPRSAFDRSHGYKTTFDAGNLIPVFIDEALPGDTMSLNMACFARLNTPLTPVMDNIYLDIFFFAVPIRLIWNNFHKFNGAQDDPGDSTDYTVPIMTATAGTGYTEMTLGDYFGIPTKVAALEHSSLFHRSYNLIFNEWFRDQNLTDSVVVDKDDGPDTESDYVLLKRAKRHDYFTSCLPWPQKGDAIDLPLGTTAPIYGDGNEVYAHSANDATDKLWRVETTTGMHYLAGYAGTTTSMKYSEDSSKTGLVADLTNATAATINSLRQAFQLQKLLERDARGGTRYTEIVRSHFGVISPDARLQRPEYLGGGTTKIHIHPVAQTESSDASTPQGTLTGFGTAAAAGIGFKKSFTEHCILMGIVEARADLTYQEGLNRMFSRSTRYDFYWPALAMIGEQAVLNKEIYADGTANDDDVFGYQERYAEYRYKPSQVTGLFRSNATGTLEIWHLSEEFGSLPTLNDTFIQESSPFDRIVATPSEPHFILDAYFHYNCVRPMPVFGVPGLIDHF